MKARFYFLLVVVGAAIFYFSKRKLIIAKSAKKIKISSSAFTLGKGIPRKYTCDGANVSPPLEWSNVPAKTRSLVLICEDLDAPLGTFVHWIVCNIDVSITSFNENQVPVGCVQGKNGFGKNSYGGPCPPSGSPHRYFFKIYALSKKLNVKTGIEKEDLFKAMDGLILGKEEIFFGTYSR
jgi:Raf kinase inhibitor-like YbhB/YbcL family protein